MLIPTVKEHLTPVRVASILPYHPRQSHVKRCCNISISGVDVTVYLILFGNPSLFLLSAWRCEQCRNKLGTSHLISHFSPSRLDFYNSVLGLRHSAVASMKCSSHHTNNLYVIHVQYETQNMHLFPLLKTVFPRSLGLVSVHVHIPSFLMVLTRGTLADYHDCWLSDIHIWRSVIPAFSFFIMRGYLTLIRSTQPCLNT